MKLWKSIAAGSGIAAVALFSVVGAFRHEGKVAANESFFSSLSVPPRQEIVTVPAGTRVHVRLEEGISSDKNSSGDHFSASLDGPLMADGKVLAPSRSKIVGQLIRVKEAGRVKGRASLTMVLQELTLDSKLYELNTHPLTLVARSTVKKDSAVIAGGAVAGTAIGAIAGGGKGAAMGAAIGGGSGTGYVLATKGEPVAYGPEARFTFTLSQPLALPVYRK